MSSKLGMFGITLGERDAHHVAGIVCCCNSIVEPGQHVKIVDWTASRVELCHKTERHGVVDPFLMNSMEAGRKFWVILNPEVTQDLRHEFTIKGEPKKEVEVVTEEVKMKSKILEDNDESDADESDRERCRREGC